MSLRICWERQAARQIYSLAQGDFLLIVAAAKPEREELLSMIRELILECAEHRALLARYKKPEAKP